MKLFGCQVGTFAEFRCIVTAVLIHFFTSRLPLFAPLPSILVPGEIDFSLRSCLSFWSRRRIAKGVSVLTHGAMALRRDHGASSRSQYAGNCQTDGNQTHRVPDRIRWGERARVTLLFFTTALRTGGRDGGDKRGPRRVHQECWVILVWKNCCLVSMATLYTRAPHPELAPYDWCVLCWSRQPDQLGFPSCFTSPQRRPTLWFNVSSRHSEN